LKTALLNLYVEAFINYIDSFTVEVVLNGGR